MALTPQGVVSTDNYWLGYWSQVYFIEDPLGVGTEHNLGSVQEGVLELSREDVEHLSVLFPRTIDFVSPAQVGMTFTGQIEEIHKRNLHIQLGDAASATSNYLYPGAGCTLEDNFGNLRLRRIRCQDDEIMTVVFWKTTGSGSFTIGGDAAVIGMPAEFKALDDSGGDFGGSATAPLGYIHAPDAVA